MMTYRMAVSISWSLLLMGAGSVAWASDGGAALWAGQVLEAGQIDRQHGGRYGEPLLRSSMGSGTGIRSQEIQTVDGLPEVIALDRIQTLVLVGPPSPGPANGDSTQAAVAVKVPIVAALPLRPAVRDSTQVDSGPAVGGFRETPDGLWPRTGRIARKLVFGTLGGIILEAV